MSRAASAGVDAGSRCQSGAGDAPLVSPVLAYQVGPQRSGDPHPDRFGRPRNHSSINERAIQFALALEYEVAHHLRVQVTHRDPMADTAERVNCAMVAQVANRGSK